VTDATQLVRYDAMCHAIAAAHEVDEVKDIRDKARAIEMYAPDGPTNRFFHPDSAAGGRSGQRGVQLDDHVTA
jgi:hypothetical protein